MDSYGCTLGMNFTENKAKRLAEAGLYAYNHNLDTSEIIIRCYFYRELLKIVRYHLATLRKSQCYGFVAGGDYRDGRKIRR